MTVFLPNSHRLNNQKNELLGSNLGVAALKRYDPDQDLVADTFAYGPDITERRKTLGPEKTLNLTTHFNHSIQDNANDSLLKRSDEIFERDMRDIGRNPISLPKTKNGFFRPT